MLLPVTHELKRPPAAPTPPSPRGAAGWKEGLTRSQNTAILWRRLWVTLDDSLRLQREQETTWEPRICLFLARSLSFPIWRDGVQGPVCLPTWAGAWGVEAGGSWHHLGTSAGMRGTVKLMQTSLCLSYMQHEGAGM